MINTIFYRSSLPHQSSVENSPTAENSMILFSSNKGKSLAKTPEQNKTQVQRLPEVSFCVTPTSSIDYEEGALEVRKRKVPAARRKQQACPIAIDSNLLFNVDK